MADDENKIKKWIKKWQKDKGDIGAGEENPHITESEEKLREAADKGDIGAGEENPHITESEEKLREAEKNFREEPAKVDEDEDEKSGDTMPPENILEHEPAEVKRHKDYPKIVEK